LILKQATAIAEVPQAKMMMISLSKDDDVFLKQE